MNILIVDDDVSVSRFIKKLFIKWGHSVEIADSGRDALKKFAKNGFEMVLLDIFLPDVKGYELIPKFRKQCPDTSIVAMTGYNTRELELKIRKKGVLFYMSKPVETGDLKSVVDFISAKNSGNPHQTNDQTNDQIKKITHQ
ncbi:response regulator [Desulfobacterales bacterium HSG17]|nr:response regulator [Desulfobacterales bacterium HSG17]